MIYSKKFTDVKIPKRKNRIFILGIEFLKKPRLFAFLGDGMYECLGENYPFNGSVYANEKGSSEEVEVGTWENGVFYKNDNWNLYCLK